MSARQKAWAKRGRENMRSELGNECAHCAATSVLEFDCIIPTGDAHHKLDSASRHSFYRAQQKAGNLQLLCQPCHSEKSKGEHPRALAECPF